MTSTDTPTGAASAGDAVVAVDLGGTLTKIAYVSRDGSATDVRRLETVKDDHGAVPRNGWLSW